jgi:protein-S-isoprenylcysteine O-methyltransferase Ste14
VTTARYLGLAVPVALVLLCGHLQRDRRSRAAALLAFIAAATGIAVLNEVARWYSFAPVYGAFRGMPIDLWLGWAALWGAVPVLSRRLLPVPVVLGLLLWLDAVAMPALQPLVRLEPGWLLGEVIGLVGVALPAQLLGRWTADRRHLAARVVLQVAVFATILLWLVPTAAFDLGDGSWAALAAIPLPGLFVLAQVGLLLALPALLAVREFAVRGGGTPYPWDPPERLVTTGPYAYLANPMQVSAAALLALLAGATRSASLGLAAVAAVAFGIGVARPHENHAMQARFGALWCGYRRVVRDWRPQWMPYSPGRTAVLWLDLGCVECRAVGRFLAERRALDLTVAAAHDHRLPLWRARYVGVDGHQERGVAAVARGLEHIHLGWAYVGWFLRCPGIAGLAQLMVDAAIAPRRPAGRAPLWLSRFPGW